MRVPGRVSHSGRRPGKGWTWFRTRGTDGAASALGAVGELFVLAGFAVFAAASEIRVDTDVPEAVAGDGRCSLIEAMDNANGDRRIHLDCGAGSGADRIILAAGGIYLLTGPYGDGANGLPAVTAPLIIDGNGASIERDAEASVFRIFESRSVLVLNSLTVAGGFADVGGGLLSNGHLTLNDVRVSDNAANRGGGIAASGELVLNRTRVVSNRAGAGGGISLGLTDRAGHSRAELNASLLQDNYADRFGGGVEMNTRDDRHPGGGAVELTAWDTTLRGNTALFGGGGLSVGGSARARLVHSVVAGNTVIASRARGGGGILLAGRARADLVDTTVSANLCASGRGGGLLAADPGCRYTVERCVIAGNRAHADHELSVPPGAFVSRGFNCMGHDRVTSAAAGAAPWHASDVIATRDGCEPLPLRQLVTGVPVCTCGSPSADVPDVPSRLVPPSAP